MCAFTLYVCVHVHTSLQEIEEMRAQPGHIYLPALLALMLLTWCSLLRAQPVGIPLVLNFDMHQYHAEHQNWSVAAREDGLVFFGNNKGLLYTDGIHWKLKAMPGNITVRSVAVSPDQRIYAGCTSMWSTAVSMNCGTIPSCRFREWHRCRVMK
jgi:hypothetical protein